MSLLCRQSLDHARHSMLRPSFHLDPHLRHSMTSFFFFFNDTATTEIYTLSLHDALPIWEVNQTPGCSSACFLLFERSSFIWLKPNAHSMTATPSTTFQMELLSKSRKHAEDRKSTRLNSSHLGISYAVFCLKKKKEKEKKVGNLLTSPIASYSSVCVSRQHIRIIAIIARKLTGPLI